MDTITFIFLSAAVLFSISKLIDGELESSALYLAMFLLLFSKTVGWEWL